MVYVPEVIRRLAVPSFLYRVLLRLDPYLKSLTFLLLSIGLFWVFEKTPPDYQQGETVRIFYLHVPCAFLSLMIYAVMVLAALQSFVWRLKVADALLEALAPVGAAFTAVALVSGALWGRPTWGTYWVWDARLTSEFILLLIYLGLMGLRRALHASDRAARVVALWTLVGAVDLPLIHYSVQWWSTLHQGQTLMATGGSKIHPDMQIAFFWMFPALIGYAAFWTGIRWRMFLLNRSAPIDPSKKALWRPLA